MKRVLYFTGYRMVAQEWSGHKLQSSVYFEPDDQGLDLFAAYLRSFRNEPIRMLVDLIEEEFRQVRIPLLHGSDRQAILNRNYAKYFRTSEYKFSNSAVEGKEKPQGRKGTDHRPDQPVPARTMAQDHRGNAHAAVRYPQPATGFGGLCQGTPVRPPHRHSRQPAGAE